jgi:8-oxo-dGTP diphosphatase
MPPVKYKAFAYITHGDRLLVFRHPSVPDAGIQVPAGTIEADESPAEAVMREAHEETGLADLVLSGFLGEQRRDMSDVGRDEVHHRHFFHLRCASDPPVTWQHWERHPSEGGSTPILFEFFWVRVPDGVPNNMVVDHAFHLPRLIESLVAQGLITGRKPTL